MVVTTVIPSIGRETLWTRAIPSLMAQTAPDWRCIIVGDGVDIPPFEDPRISVLRIDAPEYPEDPFERWRVLGVRAFNHGLDHVETEWFSYLADDDEYDSCHHQTLLGWADVADVIVGGWHYAYNGVHRAHRIIGCPPDIMDVMQGAYIMRTSLGHRALEEPTVPGAGWDACWWRRVLDRGTDIRWRVTPTVVAYYWPDVNGFGYAR